MKKIKVGEYVRTKEHGIFKVLKFVKSSYGYYWGINDKRKAFSIGKGGNLEVEIAKHSLNIIDLVEKDDYVNGCLVLLVDEETFTTVEKSGGIRCHYKRSTKNIQSIVTHEQFEAAKYEVQ